MNADINFRVGVDVGTNSVGLSAIEIGSDGLPSRILDSVVMVHDSGVDPDKQKYSITRLANSGVARRTRRMVRRRKRRLQALDAFLTNNGYPIVNLEEFADPYAPWDIRAELAVKKVSAAELPELLSVAVRHIARHRGWRSPYMRVEALHNPAPASDEMAALKQRIAEVTGVSYPQDATPAELLMDVMRPATKIRGPEGILRGKLRQSDYANELRKIAQRQDISSEFLNKLIDHVFYAESPKGSAAKRVGFDELPGQKKYRRAEKASLTFQKFRIISVAMNLRIADSDTGEIRQLNRGELDKVVSFLMKASSEDAVTWEDISDLLDVERDQLSGTAAASVEGERPYSNPPVNVTNQRIYDSNIKPLIQFWNAADDDVRSALIRELSNAEEQDDTAAGFETVQDFLSNLDDGTLEKLSNINLPAGRAAYSEDSMNQLNSRMLEYAEDLFTARKNVFGVADDWKPSPDPIGLPVGNPGVDRVLKIVNRWLMGIEAKYGIPEAVNIEHIRGGFSSELMVREYEKENNRRYERNQKVVEKILEENGAPKRVRRSDVLRYLAVSRQDCKCAYCGEPITFTSCEMDHVIPRKGVGSTNTRDNLLAVCRRCNHSKGNLPFAVWARQQANPEISLEKAKERVHFWKQDDGYKPKQWQNFKRDVVIRLSRTAADEELDTRSIEAVAWMARELANRIFGHYREQGADTSVNVFRGAITAEARKASGLERKIEMLGERGKTRLDRRHHAMDASVIALMHPYAAQVLAERINIRDAQRYAGEAETWREYRGSDSAHRIGYGKWLNSMNRLVVVFNDALRSDSIPVMENLRLRLGNSAAHDAKIRKLKQKRLGDAWSLTEIDRASTPQMYAALTRCEDFDLKVGLPDNSNRKIRVKGEWFNADDRLGIFGSGAAAIAVRGGYAEIGGTIHHARVYRINGKKPVFAMIRVFSCDLSGARDEDLFTVPLAECSISLRTAEPKLRKALADGAAEYLGWIVVGDELELDLTDTKFSTGGVGELRRDFPEINRFKVDGFSDKDKLRLRPILLSAEGIKETHSKGTVDIVAKSGWRPAVNVLFSYGKVQVVRRNALGEIREASNAHLPISWRV
ncbi:HNH endonuclease [Arcanobacterium hippocoleae]